MASRLAVALAAALVLGACGGGGEPSAGPVTTDAGSVAVPGDPGPLHVHGLGAAPDGRLYVATHTGLFLTEGGELERVGEAIQDLMGFTATEDGTLLASGHGVPPNLGLVRSADGGETWESVSLAGEADFHALRAHGERVYGFDASNGRLLASTDGGETWEERDLPGMLADLVPDPADPDRLLAAGERGLAVSADAARSWDVLEDRIGLLAWPEGGPVYLVDAEGAIHVSEDGSTWERVGETGEPPAAFLATGPEELYLADHGGNILRSEDGGRTWSPFASF